MKKFLKFMSMSALLLVLINSISASETASFSKEVALKKEEQPKVAEERISALNHYLETGISGKYTETDMLGELFIMLLPDIKTLSKKFKESGVKYENLDEFIKESKTKPEYAENIEETIKIGYNSKEAEDFFKSLISVSLLYNKYSDDGISAEEGIDKIIKEDERMKGDLKKIADATISSFSRK